MLHLLIEGERIEEDRNRFAFVGWFEATSNFAFSFEYKTTS